MDIRFEVKDKDGDTHAWRIITGRMHVTLFRFTGMRKKDDGSVEEGWGSPTYPATIPGAIRSIIREGFHTFPGEIKEVVETSLRLEKTILEQLQPILSNESRLRELDELLVKIDKDLRVFQVDEPVSIKESKEEEDLFGGELDLSFD